MSDETQQPTPEPTQPQPSPAPSLEASADQREATAGNAEPTPTPLPENPNPPATAPASPDNLLDRSPEMSQAGITIEKHETDTTITEVMQPEPEPQVPKTVFDTSVQSKNFLKGLLPKLKEKLAFRTEKRLSKIVELARKKGEIRNDDVEKLLHVSDASATNYLSKLVKRGNLRVSGPKNHSKYIPN